MNSHSRIDTPRASPLATSTCSASRGSSSGAYSPDAPAASSSAVFRLATASELMHCERHDRQHVQSLQRDILSIWEEFFSRESSLRHKEFIGLISQLLYYGFTTLSGRITLGEEFCELLPCSGQHERHGLYTPIGKLMRFLLIASRIVFTHCFSKEDLHSRASSISWMRTSRVGNTILAYLRQYWPTIFLFCGHIKDANVLLFLLFGRFYSVSHRLLRVDMLKRLSMQDMVGMGGQQRNPFAILGLLQLLRLLLIGAEKSLRKYLEGRVNSQQHETNDEVQAFEASWVSSDHANGQGPKCTLCFEISKQPACAPCGHIFCWGCLMNWLVRKPECPLCRQQTAPEDVYPVCGLV